MRHCYSALFVASTCILGLTACSGSNDSDLAAVPPDGTSQDDVGSTPDAVPSPATDTGTIDEPAPENDTGPLDLLSPESGPDPTTGPVPTDGPGPTDSSGPEAGQGPQGVSEGPPGSASPTDIGPPPDSGVGPEGGGPQSVDLETELQNAASGDQIMDSWVCNTPTGNIDYGFVRGLVRYTDSLGMMDNGTYSITSANTVTVALDTGARHTLADIAFVPIDNDSISRYFTAEHSDYGAVTCVLT